MRIKIFVPNEYGRIELTKEELEDIYEAWLEERRDHYDELYDLWRSERG